MVRVPVFSTFVDTFVTRLMDHQAPEENYAIHVAIIENKTLAIEVMFRIITLLAEELGRDHFGQELLIPVSII